MLVSNFHFDLPEELIAQSPTPVRGASRMLVVRRATGALTDDLFTNLPAYLDPGDLVVLNDSRVIPARLFGVRASRRGQADSAPREGEIEVLLTRQIAPEERPQEWLALGRPARKLPLGETIHFHAANEIVPVLAAEVIAIGEFGERTLRLSATPSTGLLAILDNIGHMPLPPYIHRPRLDPDKREDRDRYQTVFAARPGSAAAPTAGLHFTPEVLASLKAKGVQVERVTLHVGLGTFQPVRAQRVEEIRLHAEPYSIPLATLDAIRKTQARGGRIVAVGTTATRTLEQAALFAGNSQGREPGPLEQPLSGNTDLFIAPGFPFQTVGGLLTNFHLPQSTLLMLVSAFAQAGLGAKSASVSTGTGTGASNTSTDSGREMILAAYAHAIRQGYRFYSYGDCMLIL